MHTCEHLGLAHAQQSPTGSRGLSSQAQMEGVHFPFKSELDVCVGEEEGLGGGDLLH